MKAERAAQVQKEKEERQRIEECGEAILNQATGRLAADAASKPKSSRPSKTEKRLKQQSAYGWHAVFEMTVLSVSDCVTVSCFAQ